MQLTFTPTAAQRVRTIIAEKGGNVALRIRIRHGVAGVQWSMLLERWSSEAILVDGVPVLADPPSWAHLHGLVIDWVQTPQGPGFGVYERNLQQQDVRLGAD